MCQVSSDTHPVFDSAEEVSLCPTVFAAICANFEISPDIDLFASVRQHQLPRYFTADPADRRAEGYNAFNYHWTPGLTL